jgi:hypothetical protein
MPGEKQNEIKTKLDGMNTIPREFCFNHEKIWQRVDEQLNRPKEKNLAWLYAAAVLLLIVGSFLIIQNASQNRSLAIPIHYPSKSPGVKAIGQSKEEEKVQVDPLVARYVQTAKKTNYPIAKVEQIKPALDSIIVEQPIAALPSAIISDSAAKTTTIAKVPKFKIAHINELNTNEPVFDLPTPKASMALLNRRNISEVNEPVSVEEKAFIQRKQKALLPFLISSSQ